MIGFAEKSSAFTMDMHMMHAQAWMRMPARGFGPRSKPFRGGLRGEIHSGGVPRQRSWPCQEVRGRHERGGRPLVKGRRRGKDRRRYDEGQDEDLRGSDIIVECSKGASSVPCRGDFSTCWMTHRRGVPTRGLACYRSHEQRQERRSRRHSVTRWHGAGNGLGPRAQQIHQPCPASLPCMVFLMMFSGSSADQTVSSQTLTSHQKHKSTFNQSLAEGCKKRAVDAAAREPPVLLGGVPRPARSCKCCRLWLVPLLSPARKPQLASLLSATTAKGPVITPHLSHSTSQTLSLF